MQVILNRMEVVRDGKRLVAMFLHCAVGSSSEFHYKYEEDTEIISQEIKIFLDRIKEYLHGYAF